MVRLLFALCALFLATQANAQGAYAIQPGDSLRVEIIEDASLNRDVLVTPDGRITFPFAGSVQAAGRTTEQISRALATRLEPNFANPPNVYVAVQGLSQPLDAGESGDLIEVYLLGEVNSPGPREVERGTTILQLLSTAQGFTNFAATKRIQVRRQTSSGNSGVVVLNYHAVSRGAAMRNNVVLHDGDVILVPERRLFE